MNFKKYMSVITESSVKFIEDSDIALDLETSLRDMTDEEIDSAMESDSLFVNEDEELDLEFEDCYSEDCDCDLEDCDCEESLKERVTKAKVVRDGKKVIKFKSDKKGYKIVRDPESGKAKEVKMTPMELKTRQIAAKKGAKKSKTKKGASAVKRARSMRLKK